MSNYNFESIKQVLAQPKSKYFWVKSENGHFETGNTKSFYASHVKDKFVSFDISNSAIQACCGLNGSIKSLSIYRGNYRVEGSPGMWWYKDYTIEGLFSYTIHVEDESYDLNQVDWPIHTYLIDNIFPVTELKGEKLKVTLITYIPISSDGKYRPRAAIYGILIESTSRETISGSIALPQFRSGEMNTTCRGSYGIQFVGTTDNQSEIPFTLEPGQEMWTTVVFSVPGESEVLDEINHKGAMYWLNSTWSYYKSMIGSLSMPDDEFTGEFMQRMIYLALGCINTDGRGGIIGCNTGIGSAITNNFILLKDLFYYFLPFAMLDSEFFKEGILWSVDYCERPPGRVIPIHNVPGEKGEMVKTQGGVRHSLTIALMPVVMAGLYYANTGDKLFFSDHPSLKDKLITILENVIRSREKDDVWLFPSDFISDFPAYGDFHTGSNVVAWHAFKSFARIVDEIYLDSDTAREYRHIADKIKEDIERHNIIDGPYGKQYIEGVDADGGIPLMGHEGEESDTTLMPFYGYIDYDNAAYKNYTRFAMSEHNCFYLPIARGMSPGTPNWGFAISGHVTGFANVVDAETMNGEHGYMTEIRKLTDVDGSLWWWPYSFHAEEYGKVVRSADDLAAKSGFTAGVFAALYISEILGIKYDAPTKNLVLRPFSPSSGFTWENFRIGRSVFSVSYSRTQNEVAVNVTNHNDYEVAMNLEIMLDHGAKVSEVTVNDKICGMSYAEGLFLNKRTIKLSDAIMPGESRKITIYCVFVT